MFHVMAAIILPGTREAAMSIIRLNERMALPEYLGGAVKMMQAPDEAKADEGPLMDAGRKIKR